MKGYVFVTAAPGRSTEVVNALRRINGVRSADICWGLPDIVALVEPRTGLPCGTWSSTKSRRPPG
jgi:hypothetical protein